MNKIIYSLFVMAAFVCSFFTGNAKAELPQVDNSRNVISSTNNGAADFYFVDVINGQSNSSVTYHYSHRSHGSHGSHGSYGSHYSSRF